MLTNEEIGKRLRYFRDRRGLEMLDMGEAVGIKTAGGYSKYEYGTIKHIPRGYLEAWATLLNVKLGDLTDETDAPARNADEAAKLMRSIRPRHQQVLLRLMREYRDATNDESAD